MFERICDDQNVLEKTQYYLPFHFERQWKEEFNMTVWRNSPWCIFNSLKCHSSCLELLHVRGMCICRSFNKLLFFFSKMNLELNLFLPFLCLLSSVSSCHVQYMHSALLFSNYLPNFEIISETMEKNRIYVFKLNNESVYSIGIFRMLLFSHSV